MKRNKSGLGPFGVSVEIGNLDAAHRIAQEGTKEELKIEQVGNRKSFVVPAEATSGTFVEFVEQ